LLVPAGILNDCRQGLKPCFNLWVACGTTEELAEKGRDFCVVDPGQIFVCLR
jgi:hypothetical protein